MIVKVFLKDTGLLTFSNISFICYFDDVLELHFNDINNFPFHYSLNCIDIIKFEVSYD